MESTRFSVLKHTFAVVACTALLSACFSDRPADRISSGKRYLDRNDFAAAVIEFKGALQKDDQSAEARLLLGKALLYNGDPVSAAIELKKASALDIADEEIAPLLARALLFSGQPKKVTDLYGETQLSNPEATAELKSTVALAWSVLGNLEATERALAQSLSASPNHPASRVLQARLLASKGMFDEAAAIAADVRARSPRDVEAMQLQGELLWHVKGDRKGAEELFVKALEVDRRFIPAHSSLIKMRMEEQDIPGMKIGVERLRTALPKHPQTRFVEAQLAFLERNFKKARELTQVLIQAAPNHVGALVLAASIEIQDGSLLQAEPLLNKAIGIDPESLAPKQLLAKTYLRLGQPSKALQVLKPVLEGKGSDVESMAIAAEAYLQSGDLSRAEEMFRQADQRKPNDPRFKSALALARISRGEADAGMNELASIAANDKGQFADLALISTRMARNEFEQALDAANGLIKKSPQSATALTMRARVHLARDDLQSARTDLEKALAIDTSYFPAASRLAEIDLKQGKPEDAKRRFQDFLTKDSRAFPAAIALADLNERIGDPPAAALNVITEAIKASPAEPSLRLRLVAHHLRNKDARAALDAAQTGSAAAPGNQELLDALGRAQLATGDLQQAINTFRRLAGANPKSAIPHLRLSDAYTAMQNKAAADTSLRKALSLQPDLLEAQLRLVETALAGNRPKDALPVTRDIQRQKPREAVGYLLEADVQLRLKNTDAAISVLTTGVQKTRNTQLAIRLHSALKAAGNVAGADRFAADWERDNPKDLRFDFYLSSMAIVRRNDTDALKRLVRVVTAQPANAAALNNLAMLLIETDAKGALAYAEKANTLRPNQPAIMDTLARALTANNQLPRALEIQRLAVDRAPEELSLRLSLAKIALKAGNKDLARTELEKLKRQGTRFTGQAEVAALLNSI